MATETPLPALGEKASAPPPSSYAIDSDKIHLLDVLIVIARRKRLIFYVTAAFAIGAVIVSLLLPLRYTANVLLLPPVQNSSLGTQLASELGSLGSVAALASGGGSALLKNPNDMYVAMLKSRTVEDGMVEKFGLMQEYHQKYLSEARKEFEHWTTVEGSGKDGLIHISVEDRDPKRAAELANGYVSEFRKLSEHLAITEAGQRRLFFQEQMERAKDDLANAEIALARTEQKTGLIQLDSQARALIESAASLRAQITAKEVQIQGMQTYATGENAQLIQAKQELDSLRAQLARLGGDENIPGGGLIPGKGQMASAGMEYVRRLRDVKYYGTIFDILARQFEVAKLDEAKEGALIQVVDAAVPPDRRSSPKRTLIVAGSMVCGFIVAMIIALLMHAYEAMKRDGTVAGKWELFCSLISLRGRGAGRLE